MLTKRAEGTVSGAIGEATRLEKLLKAKGFRVVRTKIEAAAQIAREVLLQDSSLDIKHQYFESHIRLVIGDGSDLDRLVEAAQKHSAHLSRNVFRRNDDGRDERFITQRCQNCSYEKSRLQLNALFFEIRDLNITVVDIEEEYVVYDSNFALDSGWLQEE